MAWDKYIQDGIHAVGKADYPRAESELKRALQFAKQNYPRGDSRLAVTLSLLGHIYFKMRDFLRAEMLLEQSLRLHSQSQAHFNEPCILMDLFSLGEIKKSSGKPAEACKLYDETLKKVRDSGEHRRVTVKQATELFENMLKTASSQLNTAETAQLKELPEPNATETPANCQPAQPPQY